MIQNLPTFLSYRYFILLTAFLALSGRVFAQTEQAHFAANKTYMSVIFQHYTAEELDDMKVSDTLKYKSILYYYTSSFYVEPVTCTDCVPTDLRMFDVSKYEYLRKKEERYTREFDKYGFRLTLLSVDELLYKLPIHYLNNN